MRKLTIIILLLLFDSLYVFNAYGMDKEKDIYEKYKYQTPKQLDCQQIKFDESHIGGKVTVKTLCFYEVEYDQDKKIIIVHDIFTGDISSTN